MHFFSVIDFHILCLLVLIEKQNSLMSIVVNKYPYLFLLFNKRILMGKSISFY
jgi:hypothetical protein